MADAIVRDKRVARRVPEIERVHFEQACEMIRHHSSLRFRQLTIFGAVNGGLLLGLFRFGESFTQWQLAVFALTGVVATVAFAILEVRLNYYLDHYRAMVLDYERRFGFAAHLFAGELRGRFFRGRFAVLLFLACALVLWLLALMATAGFVPARLMDSA